jgi:hypothetical protein
MTDTGLKEQLKLYASRNSSRKRIEFILRVYSALGALTAVLALGYFLVSVLSVELTSQQTLALLISGVGVMLAVMSRLLIAFGRERDAERKEKRQSYEQRFEFVIAWNQFERLARVLLGDDGADEDGSDKPMRVLLSDLVKRNLVEPEDLALVERALAIRNMLAHGQLDVPKELVSRGVADISDVQERMKKAALRVR